MDQDYIFPILSIHSNFHEAREFHESGAIVSYYKESTKPLDLENLTQGKRNLIVGEPGIGKTSLLCSIDAYLKEKGYSTGFISLRQIDCKERIDVFLKDTPHPGALLLDALDEIQSKNFTDVLKKIETVSQNNLDLPIYISSRWAFVTKYINSFPEYRFISVLPFSSEQVRKYLREKGHLDEQVSKLLERVSSFSNLTNILQVPRYLFFLNSYLEKSNDVAAASRISRNELFEYFIYSNLDEEDKKSGDDKGTITKRLLEKLALAMEIYQTNVITKDELMTFFDEIASDLKVVALAQFNLQTLFDRSLLKTSHNSIEFDNSEFQEYLAAKEIFRLSDPNRAAFSFAVDPNIQEIFPTWFNALSFLVDMQSELLEQLVEFSGLRTPEFKVVDEGLLTFISKVNSASLSQDVRRRLFNDVVAYHERRCLWVPWDLTRALASFYDESLEHTLKAAIERAEGQLDAHRYVPLGNAVGILSGLLDAKIRIDHEFWREKLIKFASVIATTGENSVLQRNALNALETLHDSSVIDRLPNLLGSDELVARAFLSMCAAVAPDHQKSVEYFIEAIRRGELEGRYGLFRMTKTEAIKRFLSVFNTDDEFRAEFLEMAEIFRGGEDRVLVENIEEVFDEELNTLVRGVVLKSMHHDCYFNAQRSEFIIELWKLLRKRHPHFFRDIVFELSTKQEEAPGTFYFAQDFFAEVLEAEDVPVFLDAMLQVSQEQSAFLVMLKVKTSERDSAAEIYELGRAKLSELYKKWEEEPARDESSPHYKMLKKLRTLLEPDPGKYNQGVFRFFNHNFKDLNPLLLEQDRKRLMELLTETVFKFLDPIKANVTITREEKNSRSFSYSANMPLFGDAILTAKLLGLDITPYRQKFIDFIPFAVDNDLKTIFELVRSIQPNEMASVLAIYKDRKSDLWRHQPQSFVDAVEHYHIVGAVGVLKEIVDEPAYDQYTRRRALIVIDSITSDAEYLRQLFVQYEQASDDDRELANIANTLLISSHIDAPSIRWRLKEIVKRSMPFTEPAGVHRVNAGEEELWGKSFAKPLMQLKCPGFESDYLDLLDEAIRLWGKGREFHSYAQYLWEITYMYFDNLKDAKSYEPLRKLEAKVTELQDHEGANWLAARMVHLRRSYLAFLGRPRNISEAIKNYNIARAYDNKKINNAGDLFQQVQDSLDTELRRWIEGEGAYQLIRGDKVFAGKKQAYEDLIQKTLKAKIENILLRRGFQVDLIREPQLYDDKRVDILITYGFAGPIVVEVKLTSNSDLKAKSLNESKSFRSMRHYMDGYGAPYGIFLVIDNDDARNLSEIKKIFQQIPNVSVHSFSCSSGMANKPKKQSVKSRSASGSAKRSRPLRTKS